MKTTIEINGRIYDAQTGKIVSTSTNQVVSNVTHARQATAARPAQPLRRGVVMDGISKQTVHLATTATQSRTTARPAQQAIQKSQTLHRKAVKKPSGASVPYVHSTSANIPSKVERSATGRGLLLKRVPDAKLSRALQAKKSSLVSKFGKPVVNAPKITTELPVQPVPATTSHQMTKLQPEPAHTHTSTALPANNASNYHPNAKKFVFEDHIKRANSHLLKPIKKEGRRKRLIRSLKVSPKIITAGAAMFAVLLLGGFFAYQNIPSVSMRIAASKAGFPASLPESVPAGYSFNGPVEVNDQIVSLKYDSNSDDRNFLITQKPTNWSSEALLTNYLLDSQFRYQVYKDKGLTIYVYNGSNATWVDKGVWYNVNGDEGSLSSEQLLELAASI